MDIKERQRELNALLFEEKVELEKVQALSWPELIMLQQTSVQLMVSSRKDDKKFKFMEAKAKFFMLAVFDRLRTAEELFVVCSTTHHMPYVVCDEKTFDDQIYIFGREADAKAMVEVNAKKKIPLEVKRLENKQLLSFYVNLYSMGVNAMIIAAAQFGMRIQLKNFVKEPDFSKMEEKKRPVSNPSLQLTGMYFVQELRREIPKEEKKDLKEMEEEIYANIAGGKFMVLVKPHDEAGKTVEIPMMQTSDGSKFEPVFTDIVELAKFPTEGFKALVMDYNALKKTLPADATGIVINPHGIRLMIPLRQVQAQAKPVIKFMPEDAGVKVEKTEDHSGAGIPAEDNNTEER